MLGSETLIGPEGDGDLDASGPHVADRGVGTTVVFLELAVGPPFPHPMILPVWTTRTPSLVPIRTLSLSLASMPAGKSSG